MAEGPWQLYDNGLLAVCQQLTGCDFVNDAVKCGLLDTTHTVDLTNDVNWADVSGDECTDPDYTTGGIAVPATKSITIVSGLVRYDTTGDIDFGSSVTIAARYAVLYFDDHANDRLFAIADLNTGGGNLSSTSSDFRIEIHANGIVQGDPVA